MVPVLAKVNEIFKAIPVAAKDSSLLRFKITDTKKEPIIGASVMIIRGHRVAFGAVTNIYGEASLARLKILATDSIKIGFIGYFNTNFKPTNTNNDYSVTLFEGENNNGHYAYVTNNGKGYEFELAKNLLKVNFGKMGSCGVQDFWVEFKRESSL